jgi:hypothetical protein
MRFELSRPDALASVARFPAPELGGERVIGARYSLDMSQPSRVRLAGTILVVVTSATAAVAGMLLHEPLVAAPGVGVLSAVFAVEVYLSRRGSPWSLPARLTSARKRRVRQRAHWAAEQREHRDRADSMLSGADFHSWRDFYRAEGRRRGLEVAVREIADGEFCWRVIWMPTREVIAWPFRWRNEHHHRAVSAGTWFRSPTPSNLRIGPAEIPAAIFLIGRADTAEDCSQKVASATSLAELRSALSNE